MTVLVWITEGSWQACVDAALATAASSEPIVLAHVTPAALHGAAEGAFGALLGRHHRDPAAQIDHLASESAQALLAAATARVGTWPGGIETIERRGHVEREVVALAAGVRLLVCGRTGDTGHLGPRSLGHATRFVVDHAPCAVLLVWPGPAPDIATLPPPPPDHSPPR
ncbi:universal stress protein [Actinopolymorpha alba]|uniref:universal stress protein n=1 Tax=Actinopolymorpha alba TaxID=533267 RepID=UPI0003755112|nr:universal stress protein [Actinopolymorpha alba]